MWHCKFLRLFFRLLCQAGKFEIWAMQNSIAGTNSQLWWKKYLSDKTLWLEVILTLSLCSSKDCFE